MQSQLGTMVINSDDEDDEEAGTMKRRNETMQPTKPSSSTLSRKRRRPTDKETNSRSMQRVVCSQTFKLDKWLQLLDDPDTHWFFNAALCGHAHCHTSASSRVNSWTVEELRLRLASLDPQMEQEIEEIRQRYQTKRQPILDAIEAKKRRQQNF
ncbi:hypothetical protein F7725_016472 [Dissostichus mawsoni]|uniref:SARAH domain-containing protein n=1 Tax=Dissostichus mawsoni TaxID=36200 RepID=A0A7J5Z3U5_DISMA|nr:hypothetical protein F7725_016472 [Dissostichus mawsoni]